MKLGIAAPRDLPVHREEVHDRISAERDAPGAMRNDPNASGR